MNNLISVLGPTATGKTSFALTLAQQALKMNFSGVDIISADSRQVYQGLEVLSGADIPAGFKKKSENLDKKQFPFFENEKISIHGVSILKFDDDWSVAHFKNFAIEIINNSFKENRLPIIVGGTALYHDHIFNRDSSLYVEPNKEVREKASSMTVTDIQEWLKKLDSSKLASMNNSDINNKRRLVRAIEILLGKPEKKKILNLPKNVNNLKICLSLGLEEIYQKIKDRVVERLKNNVVSEVKNLNMICQNKNFPSCTSLGVSDINSFINQEIDEETCIKNWALHEFQYAKRQLVWLKKEQQIVWLDDLQKYSYTLNNEKIFI